MALGSDVNIPVTLGKYIGIEISPIEIVLNDDVVNEKVNELLAKVITPQAVTTSIKKGDSVSLSFEATVGKKPFPGSSCRKCVLTMGAGQMIGGFEEHLYAHKAKDAFTFTINFPQVHINESLEGRLVRFDVRIQSVERMPDFAQLSDELVQEVSEFDSLGELRKAVREQLEYENQSEMYRMMRASAIEQLADNCEVDVPQEWVNSQFDAESSRLMEELAAKGQTLDEHLNAIGLTEAEYAQETRKAIERSLAGNLALREIARVEGIQIDEQDMERQIGLIAENAGIEPQDVRAMLEDEEHRVVFEDTILCEKAVSLVLENAVITGEVD